MLPERKRRKKTNVFGKIERFREKGRRFREKGKYFRENGIGLRETVYFACKCVCACVHRCVPANAVGPETIRADCWREKLPQRCPPSRKRACGFINELVYSREIRLRPETRPGVRVAWEVTS